MIIGILALRVYAIYNERKRVTIFLVFLLLGSFLVNVAQTSGILSMIGNFSIYTTNVLHFDSPAFAIENMGSAGDNDGGTSFVAFSTTFSSSFSSCSFESQPVAAITWATTMAVELTLYIMALMKSEKKSEPELRSYPVRFSLLEFLMRDSTHYYEM